VYDTVSFHSHEAGSRGDEMNPATTDSEEAVQRRGRALDATRDVALRESALGLLAEIGYDRLTIDSVAARAHSSKTTIYRRWSGKAELIVDALNCRKGSSAVPDTGSLCGDLEAIAKSSTSTDNQFDAQVMIGLISALARDAELRQVFRERLIDPRMAGFKQVFERAVARGEVSKDRNLDLLVSLFPAIVIHHLLISGEVPEADFAEQVVRDVLLPLATAPTGAPNRR
jgi:AcrR family transcriptional regulator